MCVPWLVAGYAVRGKSWSREPQGAVCYDGSELVAVDDLGGAAGGVAGEAGDFLDRDAGVGHEADEGVPQFAGCPGAVDAGGCDGCPEFAADVVGVELAAVAGGEHRPAVALLALLQVGQGVGGDGGQGESAPGSWCLGVAVGAQQ